MTRMNPFVSTSISLEEELTETAERLRMCTVEVRGAGAGRGSGVVWHPDGLIITNAHVATLTRHTVELFDGRVFEAELVRREPRYDLASLQISATGLKSAQSRNAASLRAGELVLAVGNPVEATGAFTVGMVSEKPQPGDVLMKADIRLAPGNSGGPLADAHGWVVGINSMVADGIGVAVTSMAVERFIVDKSRSIGVTVQAVGLRGAGLPELGLSVIELEAGGAAYLSGVRIGDVIVRVNGKQLNRPEELSDAIQVEADALLLDVLREGRVTACEVTLVRESAAELV